MAYLKRILALGCLWAYSISAFGQDVAIAGVTPSGENATNQYTAADIAEYQRSCIVERKYFYQPALVESGRQYTEAAIDQYDAATFFYFGNENAPNRSIIERLWSQNKLNANELDDMVARGFNHGFGSAYDLMVCAGKVRASQLRRGKVPIPTTTPVLSAPLPRNQLSDETRIASMSAFRVEFGAFRERYPWFDGWSETDKNQYRLFIGTKALEILGRHESGMEKEDYDAIATPAIEMRDQGRAGCPTCMIQFPESIDAELLRAVLAAPTPIISPKPMPPTVAPPAPKIIPAPKITLMAALGNGCVTALGRNYRQNEIDQSTRQIDLVLKNSCGKPQVVKVDVSGLHMLGWPAVYNIGLWASTANADVPVGIPFKPIISMAEGGPYKIDANGEHVADGWIVPPLFGSDNELRIWVASCDAYSSSGMQQVIFRPALHFAQDSRAFCGPSRLR